MRISKPVKASAAIIATVLAGGLLLNNFLVTATSFNVNLNRGDKATVTCPVRPNVNRNGNTVTITCPGTPSPSPSPLPSVLPSLSPLPSLIPSLSPNPSPSPSPLPSPVPSLNPSCDVIANPGTGLSSAVAGTINGGTLCLHGGTYTVASVIYTSRSINIVAFDGEVPVITHPTNRPDFLYFTGGPVLVRGLTFMAGQNAPSYNDGNGSALSEVEGGHDVTYENVTFKGAPNMGESQQLAYIRHGERVFFKNCIFIANGTDGFGVHIYPGPEPARTVVEDSNFSGFGISAAITAYAPLTANRNIFSDSRLAIQLRYNASGSIITNNTGIRLTQGIEAGSGITYTATNNNWGG